MASSAVADNFTSRDDTKKQKQLQEARAAGTAAPELDAATGKMINPHNPQFITSAPWYLNQNKPSLKHQQAWNLKSAGAKDWYMRGTKGDVKTKFIKGACENCGATTHSKKDCVERPRQVGAKFNGKNLMPDEYIENLDLDYEGKHDRWNGFQPDDYKEVIDEWEKVEAQRRTLKAAEMEERAKLKERLKAQKKELKRKRKLRRRQLRRQAQGKGSGTDTDGTEGDSDVGDSDTDTDTDSDSDASDDEDLGEKMKDFDKTTATVAARDDKLRTTTRNLRIREDTAKYLLNLDVNSAFYDPKSRSMRDDPLKHLKDEEKGNFRGDNFLRTSGDSKALTELTIFAWDAYKHGEKVHDVAQPTQALKMFNVFKQRSKDLKAQQQQELVEKYGGQDHMNAPQELLFSQNDTYVEYTRDGRILKGRERALVKSKYEEDVLIGNHSSPWGSWYCSATHTWGFACCHQTMKNAYCVPISGQGGASAGADGALAIEEVPQTMAAVGSTTIASKEVDAAPPTPGAGGEGGEAVSSSSSSDSSNDSEGSAGRGKDAAARAETRAKKRKARALEGLKLYGSATTAGGAASSSAGPEATTANGEDGASKFNKQRSSAFGHGLEDLTEFNGQKVAEAMEQEKKRRKAEKKSTKTLTAEERLEAERQRKYGSVMGEGNCDVTAEEYEAYRLMKPRSDDPMAQFT